ncbi:chemotaxis protein CheA [Desulfohalovibrio reitneri]|uniref:chemotaxis protein CheA n=1 Tax=Desulfohalovibrio reitneri TaxID=1307759 RepID=UPI0004A725DC|nr:chemotaxis protein CheA [Desulfohalovibrio reitneri]
MSQDFMDPEIFADFIVEAKEHLETIEPTLLELEKTPDNIGLLNDIFRPMHSLKGASGFLGLNKINGLAHKAENVLDELRTGSISVNTEIMDVILAATDALRTMIDTLEAEGNEGDVDTEPLIQKLAVVLKGGNPSDVDAAGEGGAGGGDEASGLEPADEEPSEPARFEPETEARDESAVNTGEAEEEEDLQALFEAEEQAREEIGELPPFEPETYKLTTIGEGHLSDFLEEAREIVENLNSCLVKLEQNPSGDNDIVNDTFRYFHNLKGNSGIIGYKELNALTHEAETLLNRVRKGEVEATQPMVDLLLSAVDLIDELVGAIDSSSGEVTTIDTRLTTQRLRHAVSTGEVEARNGDGETGKAYDEGGDDAEAVALAAAERGEPPTEAAAEFDPEDVQIFVQAMLQQIDNFNLALQILSEDDTNKDFIDGLYRSLTTVQSSSGYMGFDDIRTTAERTAGLVDQARKSDMDFSLMLDILKQECSILEDTLRSKIEELTGAKAVTPGEADRAAGLGEEPPEPSDGEPFEEEPVTETPGEEAVAVSEAPEPEPEKTEPEPRMKAEEPAESAPKEEPKPAESREAKAEEVGKKAEQPKAKSATKADSGQAAAGGQAKPKTSSTIRVDHEKLDHLMNLIGELIINRNRFAMLGRALEEGQQDVQEVAQDLLETTDAMNRISDDLQDTIMNVRMVPVGTVFSRFPRLVRDMSRKTGKQVELIMEGEDTELDKSVVEVIGDPLVHMIRNSMDHGLESSEKRREIGKPATGKVWLRAYHKGNSVAIEVEDDGKGIDPEGIKQSAIGKGVITEEQAAQMDDREAQELIFAPGFSSAEEVTDISGRGVGMDVVRSNIKNLKGNVAVTSEVGKGTKITLSLPLTLAIIDALMVKVAGDTFAIPLDAVSETTKIEAKRLTDVNNRKALELRGEVLGIVELGELMGMRVVKDEEDLDLLPMVIIQDNDRRLGVVVDRLLERQEIVIKPLGQYLSDFNLKGLSGATIMGDGSVVLILDPHEMYALATASARGK